VHIRVHRIAVTCHENMTSDEGGRVPHSTGISINVVRSFRRKIQHAGSGSANSPAMAGAWSLILADWPETLNVKKIFASLGDENS
jgi:hypothetical protein